MPRDVAVVGAGYSAPETFTDFRKSVKSKEELAGDAIGSALESASVEADNIDATVFTTVDGFEATNRIERTLETFGQDRNIPLLSIHTGGTGGGSAFKAAYEQVAGGDHDLVLVYGSSTFDSALEGQQIMNTAAPPLYEKPIISAIHMQTLYGSKYMDSYGATEEDFGIAAEKNYRAASRNPWAHRQEPYTAEEINDSEMVAWPARRLWICPVSAGSCALVMAAGDLAEELTDEPAWIDSIKSISNTFLTGYRTYESFPKLELLGERVYEEAGIDDPMEDVDIVESFNPYIPFELMQYEALDFCEYGEGSEMLRSGMTAHDGELPWNVSGGVLCTNSGICAATSRHVEIALQLMGEAGERQVDDLEVGLAHSWGSNLGQFHTLAAMSKSR